LANCTLSTFSQKAAKASFPKARLDLKNEKKVGLRRQQGSQY
jgi:hypothetical protein